MKKTKLFLIAFVAIILMSSSSKQLEFNKVVVLTFKKLDGWSKWHTPENGKAWKIENVWSSLNSNSKEYIIQINNVETRHRYNEEFTSFWISEKDSIRLLKRHKEFDFAMSILEYNIIE